MSLVAMLNALPTETIAEIQTAIINAGLRAEFKVNHKPVFKRLRDRHTGKAKKIYGALARVDRDQMQRLSDIIVDYKRAIHEKETQNQPILQRPDRTAPDRHGSCGLPAHSEGLNDAPEMGETLMQFNPI